MNKVAFPGEIKVKIHAGWKRREGFKSWSQQLLCSHNNSRVILHVTDDGANSVHTKSRSMFTVDGVGQNVKTQPEIIGT